MKKESVKQSVVFPVNVDVNKLVRENEIMKDALKRISLKNPNPEKCVENYELQSCITIAEETIEEIEGD